MERPDDGALDRNGDHCRGSVEKLLQRLRNGRVPQKGSRIEVDERKSNELEEVVCDFAKTNTTTITLLCIHLKNRSIAPLVDAVHDCRCRSSHDTGANLAPTTGWC